MHVKLLARSGLDQYSTTNFTTHIPTGRYHHLLSQCQTLPFNISSTSMIYQDPSSLSPLFLPFLVTISNLTRCVTCFSSPSLHSSPCIITPLLSLLSSLSSLLSCCLTQNRSKQSIETSIIKLRFEPPCCTRLVKSSAISDTSCISPVS